MKFQLMTTHSNDDGRFKVQIISTVGKWKTLEQNDKLIKPFALCASRHEGEARSLSY